VCAYRLVFSSLWKKCMRGPDNGSRRLAVRLGSHKADARKKVSGQRVKCEKLFKCLVSLLKHFYYRNASLLKRGFVNAPLLKTLEARTPLSPIAIHANDLTKEVKQWPNNFGS
jgi:hypothetical protein